MDGIAGVINGDDSGSGFKLFGGYEFNEHFAIELGYDFTQIDSTGLFGNFAEWRFNFRIDQGCSGKFPS